MTQAWVEYMKQVWGEYLEVVAAARAETAWAHAQAQAEYVKAMSVPWAEEDKVVTAAWAQYVKKARGRSAPGFRPGKAVDPRPSIFQQGKE